MSSAELSAATGGGEERQAGKCGVVAEAPNEPAGGPVWVDNCTVAELLSCSFAKVVNDSAIATAEQVKTQLDEPESVGEKRNVSRLISREAGQEELQYLFTVLLTQTVFCPCVAFTATAWSFP